MIIHKVDKGGLLGTSGWSACKVEAVPRYTLSYFWNKVTCKKCLNTREVRKGKIHMRLKRKYGERSESWIICRCEGRLATTRNWKNVTCGMCLKIGNKP